VGVPRLPVAPKQSFDRKGPTWVYGRAVLWVFDRRALPGTPRLFYWFTGLHPKTDRVRPNNDKSEWHEVHAHPGRPTTRGDFQGGQTAKARLGSPCAVTPWKGRGRRQTFKSFIEDSEWPRNPPSVKRC